MSTVKPERHGIQSVRIPSGSAVIEGELILPEASAGVVVFAHGSGSSRFSPRNQYVARAIRSSGTATLLMDLLTREEERIDEMTRRFRFDIALLASRLADAARWLLSLNATRGMRIGFFGASTGGGAALVAAAELGVTAAADQPVVAVLSLWICRVVSAVSFRIDIKDHYAACCVGIVDQDMRL